jgi:hypothetical protein
MKPEIQLNPGETLLYETQPKQVLATYNILFLILMLPVFMLMGCIAVYLKYSAAVFSESLSYSVTLAHADGALIIETFIVILIFVYCWLNLAIKKYWYFITNERCIKFSYFGGVNKQIVLFSDIVDVDISQNMLQTLFGIRSVIINAPVMRPAGKVVIAGLTAESAEKISNIIGEQMRAASKK